jgi:predicted nucleic acid-binding protein
MTVLLDTSVLIDHLRGVEAAQEALRTAAGHGHRLAASVVTKVEVLAGVPPAEEHRTRGLLDLLAWIPVDDAIAERAGALANRFLRSHPGVDPVDHIIAATAMELEAELWTRNVRHFPMFDGLRSPY